MSIEETPLKRRFSNLTSFCLTTEAMVPSPSRTSWKPQACAPGMTQTQIYATEKFSNLL